MAAATSILLAACSGPGPGASGASGAPPTGGIAHPTGADELVFSLSYEGGFVPVEFIFSSVPSVTIAGDGTVVVQGAQIDLFPGPALPPVMSRRLSEAGMQLILERIAETGFFAADAEFLGAQMGVADASNTVFTLHADDRDVRVSVYALGFFAGQDPPPGLPERERQAHAVLAPLAEQLTALDQLVPASAWEETDWHPYQADALRLLVRNVDAEPPGDAGIPSEPMAWPIDADPATFGEPYPPLDGSRCGAVTGDEAIAWYEALATANQLTRFTAGDHAYSVLARPVLPGEEPDCVVAQPAG